MQKFSITTLTIIFLCFISTLIANDPNERLLLITGCGRSGTQYTSLVLQECGLKVTHEKMGKDGCVSWFRAVDKKELEPGEVEYHFKHIFHQVRNPIDVISSWYYNEMSPKSWMHIWEHIPQITPFDSHLACCAKYWCYWNLEAEKKAEWRYRIEDFEQIFDELSQRLGVKLDKARIRRVPKDTNTRKTIEKKVSWKRLKKKLRPSDFALLVSLAEKYGYPTKD